jgi:hypothetical protein
VCRASLACMAHHGARIKQSTPNLTTTSSSSSSSSSGGAKAQVLRACVLSACMEAIGHCALLLRGRFQAQLVRFLYPLVQLRVCGNSIVAQAAASTLDRLGLYVLCSMFFLMSWSLLSIYCCMSAFSDTT